MMPITNHRHHLTLLSRKLTFILPSHEGEKAELIVTRHHNRWNNSDK